MQTPEPIALLWFLAWAGLAALTLAGILAHMFRTPRLPEDEP